MAAWHTDASAICETIVDSLFLLRKLSRYFQSNSNHSTNLLMRIQWFFGYSGSESSISGISSVETCPVCRLYILNPPTVLGFSQIPAIYLTLIVPWFGLWTLNFLCFLWPVEDMFYGRNHRAARKFPSSSNTADQAAFSFSSDHWAFAGLVEGRQSAFFPISGNIYFW